MAAASKNAAAPARETRTFIRIGITPIVFRSGSLLCLRRLVSLSQPRAAQNIAPRAISLVAGVFINMFAGCRPGVFAGPGLCPRCRILDREAIEQRFGVDAREALDHVQILTRSSEPGLVGEIGGVDDQRVALPMTDRVAHPLADFFRKMLRVHPDDSGIVDHLG